MRDPWILVLCLLLLAGWVGREVKHILIPERTDVSGEPDRLVQVERIRGAIKDIIASHEAAEWLERVGMR